MHNSNHGLPSRLVSNWVGPPSHPMYPTVTWYSLARIWNHISTAVGSGLIDSSFRASLVERVNLDVYIFIYTSIYTLVNFTRPRFSVERVYRTWKSGRVYLNGYIFKRLYFQRLYFQTAIFPTAIFLIYINHPYHLSSSTLLPVTSLLT